MDSSVYWYGHRIPQVEPLRTTVNSEVVIVGGGIAGLTCAQALAERGVDVALVEQAFCGSGASGKSSGFITPDSELELSDLVANYGDACGQELWEFARSGVERIRETIKALSIDCDYQIQDSLFVARTARALRTVIEVEQRTHASLGYQSTAYDKASLQKVLGSRVYQGGFRQTGTFGINAFAYCRALGDALARKGVRIFEGTPVTRLTARGVETPDGAVTAPTVAVLTDRELPALGLATRAVYHIQTFLSISKPLNASEIQMIFPEDRLMVWDSDLIYQYFRITGEGRLLLGGADLPSMYSQRESRSSVRIARKLHRFMSRHFPSLRFEIEHLWPGLIGVSPDFAPVVGRHHTLPSVYFAGAGAGLPWSAALGEYLAQKITEGRDELDKILSPLRPFPIGRRVQSLLGKPGAFMVSHGISKYGQRSVTRQG
jgi:gamma-glutamylputrescine oxidase